MSHLRPTLRIIAFTGSSMALMTPFPIMVFGSVAIIVTRAIVPVMMTPVPVPLTLPFTLSITFVITLTITLTLQITLTAPVPGTTPTITLARLPPTFTTSTR